MTLLTNVSHVSAIISAVLIVLHGICITPVENARILAVETIGGKSHWNFMSALLRSLTDAGHEVTVFTPFPDGQRENYTEIDTSEHFEIVLSNEFDFFMKTLSTPTSMVSKMTDYSRHHCDLIMQIPQFDEIMRNRNTGLAFDLIIMEPLSINCMSHVARTLNLPIVYSIPSPMLTPVERDFTGHLSNTACVSNVMANHAVPRTFVQRFTNTLTVMYTTLMREYKNWLLRVTDPRPYDSSPFVSPSVIFQNSYHGTEASRPVSANLIDVGGIHLRPAKKIPKDILDFIEESSHGVIFFTFGSTIKASSLPKIVLDAFKEVLSKVPQRVLWKYEDEMKDLPNNMMIRKWFPQRDILLHPKVKLFISHGGISGVYEALDAGVPVLGFPVFYDQPRNIDNLVNAQMAISMDVLTISKDTLLDNILELINNEKYAKNAKIASNRFRDRPISPEQSVIYWTEYVIRHKGAPHLRYQGYNLTWYQYYLLDVVFVILVFIIIVLCVMYKLFKIIFNYNSRYWIKKDLKIQ